MKILEKGLTEKEFDEYCVDKSNNLEGNTYFGQIDEEIAFSGGVKVRRIYSEDNDEVIEILYAIEYNEETRESTYTIYDEIWD